mmetsp:Transcript_37883/g.120758  ORF Transcript_37883/g.120758 Transcript_37883/m.120758 type:complete len:893 (-) Transcript_37883:135-2813(-)
MERLAAMPGNPLGSALVGALGALGTGGGGWGEGPRIFSAETIGEVETSSASEDDADEGPKTGLGRTRKAVNKMNSVRRIMNGGVKAKHLKSAGMLELKKTDEHQAFLGKVLGSMPLMRRCADHIREVHGPLFGTSSDDPYPEIERGGILNLITKIVSDVKACTATTCYLETVAELTEQVTEMAQKNEELRGKFNSMRASYLDEVAMLRAENRPTRGNPDPDPDAPLQPIETEDEPVTVKYFFEPTAALLAHEQEAVLKIIKEKVTMIFETIPGASKNADLEQLNTLVMQASGSETKRLQEALARKTKENARLMELLRPPPRQGEPGASVEMAPGRQRVMDYLEDQIGTLRSELIQEQGKVRNLRLEVKALEPRTKEVDALKGELEVSQRSNEAEGTMKALLEAEVKERTRELEGLRPKLKAAEEAAKKPGPRTLPKDLSEELRQERATREACELEIAALRRELLALQGSSSQEPSQEFPVVSICLELGAEDRSTPQDGSAPRRPAAAKNGLLPRRPVALQDLPEPGSPASPASQSAADSTFGAIARRAAEVLLEALPDATGVLERTAEEGSMEAKLVPKLYASVTCCEDLQKRNKSEEALLQVATTVSRLLSLFAHKVDERAKEQQASGGETSHKSQDLVTSTLCFLNLHSVGHRHPSMTGRRKNMGPSDCHLDASSSHSSGAGRVRSSDLMDASFSQEKTVDSKHGSFVISSFHFPEDEVDTSPKQKSGGLLVLPRSNILQLPGSLRRGQALEVPPSRVDSADLAIMSTGSSTERQVSPIPASTLLHRRKVQALTPIAARASSGGGFRYSQGSGPAPPTSTRGAGAALPMAALTGSPGASMMASSPLFSRVLSGLSDETLEEADGSELSVSSVVAVAALTRAQKAGPYRTE